MSLAFAFIAGLITFIDPCVIATVPVYLGYLAAQPSPAATITTPGQVVLVEGGPDRAVAPVAVKEAEGRPAGRWPLVRRALAFVAGFSSLFLLIGVLVITLGRAMAAWVPWIYVVGAILTILIGLALLGRLVGPLSRLANRLRVLPFIQSPRGAFTLGLAMAVAWIPCIGPIMAVIAAVSSVFEQVGRGIAFLLLFCVGLGLPFVAAAFWGEALLARLRRLGRVATAATAVAGVMMILIGVLVLTHDGYEALEHRVEDFYHQTIPGAFEWREEAQYEDWWDHWFEG
jgi:cytochrome c-type biogenesis protein